MTKIANNLLLLLTGALICFLFLKQCNPSNTVIVHETKSDTVVKIDSVIIYYPIIKWKPSIRIIKEVSVLVYDSNACKFNRVYLDTLINERITIYTKDSINGYLIHKSIDYALQNDTIINNTITITDSIPFEVERLVSGIYINGGIAINSSGPKSILIGLDYNTKKNIGFGYQFDVARNTHNATIRWRLRR